MSAAMIATTALIIASTAHNSGSGGGSSCPVSDFGYICLATFLVLMVLSFVSIGLAAMSDWSSKRSDYFAGSCVVFMFLAVAAIVVGMVHDC